MDPAVAIVLGQDPAPFEQLLQRLLSPSNDDRGEAERIFNLCKQHPDALVLRLVAALQSSAAGADVRTIGAVLLRRVITKDSVSLWPQLSPATQATVKTELLASVQREPTKAIWKKLCDTIAELAAGIVESGTWPELLPFMFQCVSSSDDRLKEASLLIFAQLVHFFQSQLKPHLLTLHNVLLQCLSQSANPDVRIAALRAAANFVEALETPEELTQFQDLLPGMMQTLNLCLQSKDEASAQEALEMLIEVAGIEPRYMRKQLTDVIAAMLQIAESTQLEDATRHLAIEFLITLSEARERAPGMMRKVPHLVGRLFAVLMAMLLDIEDTPEWHAANDEEEDSGETANYEVAQECLDRLAISVGGNTVLPVASQALPAYANDADWKKRHAALVCLAQIAEGCTKVMSKSLESVVDMVLAAFNDPNPRVRWAAINAVGQLSTDLGPDLQQQHHARVLPALIAAMDDAANPRVQAHATAAILNFSEAATPEIMAPYLDQLLNKLLQLLQFGKRMVQEGSLTAIAAIADCSQEHFSKYYDGVMPYLKTVLTQAGDKEQRMLRAKAMEAISLVGMAVGKDKFRADAKEVMQVLVSLQSAPMEDDDLTMSYMLQAWARLCKCLGAEFLPFMHVVMPPLLHSASLKPDVTISDIDDDTANDDDDDDSVETITIGDKKIGIRTSMLEEKATACNMLCCYADELKEGFFPWIDQVAQLMVPLLKFYFHEEVRKAAAQSIPELLLDGKLAVEKGVAPAVTATAEGEKRYLKQMVDFLVPPLVEVLTKEPEVEMIVVMLESLQECIQLGGAELSAEQVAQVVAQLKAVVEGSRGRRKERLERTQTEDFDEEESELLQEENEQEDEVLDQVGDCIGELVRVFKGSFKPFADDLAPFVLQMMDKSRPSTERRVGICIFDDLAENMGDAAASYFPAFLPHILEAVLDPLPEIRQSAAYGIGICAQHGGAAFTPYVPDTVARLGQVVSSADSKTELSVSATDNAISALGRLCEHQAHAPFDSAHVLSVWLAYLPIREDRAEAKVAHAQLCGLLERSDARILGPNNQNLPHIVGVLLEVLKAGTDLATEETNKRAGRQWNGQSATAFVFANVRWRPCDDPVSSGALPMSPFRLDCQDESASLQCHGVRNTIPMFHAFSELSYAKVLERTAFLAMAGKRAALAMLAVLAVVGVSCAAADDGKVLTLDFTNFESEVKDHDFIAVMFYAPWCGHCKRLEPEYLKAAEMLAEEGSEIVLARINGDEKKHKAIARKYGVAGFPTIKIFRTDYASPLTYKGPREAAGLVAYLKKQAGPASTKVRSGSDLKRAMEDDSVVVVGLFSTLSSPEFESYLSVARELRTDFVFKHTTDASLLPAKGPELQAPAVRLLKQFDEGYSDTQELSPAALKSFIERHAVPRVVEFSQDPKDRPYLARVFQAPINKSLLFLTYSLPDAPEFRSRYVEAAQEQPDSIRLVIGEAAANEHALKYFGLAVSDTPAMVIHDPRYDAKFIRTHIAPSDIAPFLADFQAGRAERVLKSEAVAQGDSGAVKKVVANSFKDTVLNSRKNVLLEFHAPWCTACADLDPVLKDVAESLSGQRDVVVAKMDFSANDIPSDKFDVKALPTIYLYTSAGVAVPYAGDNSKASLLAFVRKHKGSKMAAASPPSAEELAEAEEIANAEEEGVDERKDEL
ncbi:unnamed protein product [Closterium sp. Yama58-4]|nr:unnamed protein product [Closterium sp. Yama58-4]